MTTTSSTTTFTPITIDASTLVAYYSAKAGMTSATASATGGSTAKPAGSAPSAPWSTGVTTATLTAAATRVLNGGAFIDPSAAKLDVATSNTDYKNLFALYQGLSALEGLAQSAQDSTLSAADRLRLQTKFADGLAQVQGFVAGSPFKKLTVTQGAAAASVTTTSGVKAEDDSYVTAPLATGSANDPDPSLDGTETFSMTVTRGGTSTDVDFDLSEISGPLSLSAVEQYMNGKLKAAGALTRVSIVDTPGAAQTITAGGQTFTVGTAPDSLALSINGSPDEAVSFSAPAATPAVYLAQTSQGADASASALSLAKLDPAGASGASTVFDHALPAGVSAVRATATGPDGSVYVLADLDGTTPDGQTVKGVSDTALLRYDSTGALTYTRTLGASDSASGYGLSVSPDGKSVAITGTVTGALDGSSGADPNTADSFVSVFDAAQGVEQWTARAGGDGDDRPSSVAWGADGSVYIAGSTAAGLPGVPSVGGTDAYVQGFSSTGTQTFATVYGTSRTDAAAGLVVTPDGSLVTAGVQDGHAVLNRFSPPFTDGAQPTATRDLGPLGGGSITGLGLASDGSLVVAGVASGGLALGTTSGAYAGGREVFAASLSADLQPAASDSGTWWTPPVGQDPTAASAVVQGGQVYVTGQTSGPPVAGATTSSFTGYAVALDPHAGATWSRSFSSADGQDAPSAITVDPTGVSALDKLGLPKGAISFAGATDLVSNTSLRAGDSFQVAVGTGTPITVTVAAGDTLAKLADKVTAATGGRAAATVTSANGYDQLQITPASSNSTLKLIAGPDGADALKGLGLSPTLVTKATSTAKAPTAAPYALGLSGTYDLSTADSAKAAFTALSGAVSAVEKAYTDMSAPPPAPGNTTGTVPAYLTAQIAQYQLALSRLTGSG